MSQQSKAGKSRGAGGPHKQPGKKHGQGESQEQNKGEGRLRNVEAQERGG